MRKAKSVSSAVLIKKLEADGFRKLRQTGDHVIFGRPGHPLIVVVPHPRKDMTTGTLRSIYRQAGWNWKER